MWEHSGRCLCGRRSYLFGQCPHCLREEAQEQEQRRQEERFNGDPLPGPLSELPAPGAVEPTDAEEDDELVGTVALPNALPIPVVHIGTETSSVVFVTDAAIHSFVAEYGELVARGSIREHRGYTKM